MSDGPVPTVYTRASFGSPFAPHREVTWATSFGSVHRGSFDFAGNPFRHHPDVQPPQSGRSAVPGRMASRRTHERYRLSGGPDIAAMAKRGCRNRDRRLPDGSRERVLAGDLPQWSLGRRLLCGRHGFPNAPLACRCIGGDPSAADRRRRAQPAVLASRRLGRDRWCLQSATQHDRMAPKHAIESHARDAKFLRCQRDILLRTGQRLHQRPAFLV